MQDTLLRRNRFERWLESGVDLLVKYGGAVESAVHNAFLTLSTEVKLIGEDLQNSREQRAAGSAEGQPASSKAGLGSAIKIFTGAERRQQLQSLAETPLTGVGREVKAAQKQLVVGAATVCINLLAGLFHPVFYLFGAAGILYQSRTIFTDAYRSITKEKRTDINVTSAVVIGGALLTGSITAVTVAAFVSSGLRWIVVKTESVVQHSVASAFTQNQSTVWLLVDGCEVQVPFAQVQVGDIVIVAPGEMIPVDGSVVRGQAAVDQQALTGEGQLTELAVGDRVLASSVVLSGRLYVSVARSGPDTMAAQIKQALLHASEYKRAVWTRTEERIDRLLIPFAAFSLLALPLWGVSSALAILWVIPGQRIMLLGPTTMLCFMSIASRQNILIKNGQVLERLRAVDTVVFDKTGTLTTNRSQVGQVFCFGTVSADELVRLAVTAEHGQTHPIALAIQQLAQERSLGPAVAYDPEIAVGLGAAVTLDGVRVLVGSERLMERSKFIISPAIKMRQAEVHERGNTLVFIAQGQEVVGALEICPVVRPEAKALVAELIHRGKQVYILSGDHEAPTAALAKTLGVERFFAQVLPTDKSQVIEALHREQRTVCFVGDGINDALALKQADVSISLKGSTSVATNVAQVVLMSGNLNQLIALFDLAERFEHHMRYNRLTTYLPAFVIVGGTLSFGWGLLTAIILNNICTPFAVYNSVIQPITDSSSTLQLAETPQQPHSL